MNPVMIVKIIATVVSTAVALWYVFHKQIEWNKDDATVWDQIFNRLLDRGARAEKRVARGKETPDDLYSTPEQVFLTLAYLETEVNNGGFDQFFFNTHDSLNDMLVLSAETVKAFDIAAICEQALAIHELQLEEEEEMKRLNDCDNAFYASKDNLTQLVVQYARETKEFFK